jgi:hypothetical protein
VEQHGHELEAEQEAEDPHEDNVCNMNRQSITSTSRR